jgi:hypothetical protein
VNGPLIPDADAIRASWSVIVHPGDVHELRVPNPKQRYLGVVSGYINDEDAFVQLASGIEGKDAEGVYVTLNPVNPALLF